MRYPSAEDRAHYAAAYMLDEIKIVPLEESQIDAAGVAMARAFFIDPIMEYMFPD